MYELRAQSDKQAEMKMYGSIGEYDRVRAVDFIDKIIDVKAKGYEQLKLKIHSPGGSQWEGIAIYSQMFSYGLQIHGVVEGIAASMMSVVLQGCNRRSMFKGTRLMVHEGAGGVMGSAKYIRDYADLVESMNRTLAEILAKRSKRDVDYILKNWMAEGKDTWFTPEKALEEGLIDDIIEGRVVPMEKEQASLVELAAHYSNQLDTTENAMDKATKDKLIAKLGLKPEATDAEILTAVESLEKKPSHDDSALKAVRTQLITKLGLKAEATDSEIIAAADAAKNEPPKGEKDQLVEGVIMIAKERGITDEKKLAAIKDVADKVGIASAIALMPEPQKPGNDGGSLNELIAQLKGQGGAGSSSIAAERKDWNYSKWSKEDSAGLAKMAAEKTKDFIALFKAEFNYEPSEAEIKELTSIKN